MKIRHCGAMALCAMAFIGTGCEKRTTPTDRPVSVRVMNVKAVPVEAAGRYSATVEEASGATLSFSVAGTVRQICVEPGSRVARGQLIATLDETSLRSTYEGAQATLGQAEDACRRMQSLYESGSLPEMQWVGAQTQLQQARAAEQVARKNLTDCRLYAPFAGVVAEKDVETGHNVMPGQPVVRVVSIDRVKVSISVPENEIAGMAVGESVRVHVEALGGKVFTGRIAEKGVTADPLTRSYAVKALVENPAGELLPGMICTLDLENRQLASAIVLPAEVVCRDERNNCFVWVNRQGKASRKSVTVGGMSQQGVIITAGLSDGDRVIVGGWQKVSDGMAVSVEQ